MPHTILKLDNVSFNYPGGNTIIQDMNLEINQNDLIIIKGESGAGKSTFLQLFNRFCDSSKGRILFHEKDLNKYKIDQIRRSLIYLPQLPVAIEGTIEKNLAFPFSFHSHKNKKFNPVKAREWLDYFQLNLPLHHDGLKLSIGQKQRIALIRSILLEPEVLLLDEPGSALDSNNKRLIEQKIEHIIDSTNVTVLMATHSEVSFTGTHYRILRLKDKNLMVEQ